MKRIDERRLELDSGYRFGYLAARERSSRGFDEVGFDCVAKRDFQTGKTEFLKLGDGRMPGEPVFVPRGGTVSEDDGWVMSVWYDPAINSSELVIQEAGDFAGRPVARIKAPHRVPFGFHGNWVPEA